MSCVAPAYYVHGLMQGRIDFPTWLGQNSKTAKNWRLLRQITNHAHLHSGMTIEAMRMDVAPLLSKKLIKYLRKGGEEGINEAIALLDSCSLTKEDAEALLELMLDPAYNIEAFKAIPTATKSAFTRQYANKKSITNQLDLFCLFVFRYNKTVHLLPYSMDTDVSGARRIKAEELPPDLLEVDVQDSQLAVGDEEEAISEDKEEQNEITAKDKMIKVVIGSGSRKPAAGAALKASSTPAAKRGRSSTKK